jgi:hypothetical protein
MCEVVSQHKQQDKRSRKSKLSIENQLLLTLSFWRRFLGKARARLQTVSTELSAVG